MGGFACPILTGPVLELENLEFINNILRRTGGNSSFSIQICTFVNSNSLGLTSSMVQLPQHAAFLTTARDYTKQRWVLVMVVI